MGWSNYIIIKDWKIVIETSREVDELEDYIKESLDKILDDDTYIDMSTSDLKVSDITVADLCTMASAYDNVSSITCMNTDKLFLYWLKNRGIEHEIKSEYNIDLKKYKEDGYKIVSRWESDSGDDNDNDNDSKHDESGN